jgi:cytidylate kinase
MYAPREWRVRHLMDGHNVDERTATAEVDRIDRARAQYMQVYYGVKWTDPGNYDLALDTSVFGAEGSAEVIVRAVQAR